MDEQSDHSRVSISRSVDDARVDGQLVPPGSASPPPTTERKSTKNVTKDRLEKARAELLETLNDERQCLQLQIQLMVHLDELKASIAAAESEERVAKMALQQAEVIRTLKLTENPGSNPELEPVTIVLRPNKNGSRSVVGDA